MTDGGTLLCVSRLLMKCWWSCDFDSGMSYEVG